MSRKSFRMVWYWLAACGLALAVMPRAWCDPVALDIPLAQQRTLSFAHGVSRLAVGDAQVADVKTLGGRELLITALALGTTSLNVWLQGQAASREYQVKVTPADALRATLDAAGLNAEPAGKGLVVNGAAVSLPEYSAALSAAAQTAGGKESVVDAGRMGISTQVQTDIKIVEISHTKLKNAGFFLAKNTNSITGVVSPPGVLSSVTGDGGGFALGSGSGFLPGFDSFNLVLGSAKEGVLGVLSVLEGNGFAYTLAEPSLVTLSGQDASFLVGGEFPIPVRQGTGDSSSVTIEYKQFGIRLFLTPTVLSKEQIMLRVAPEVSELDFSTGVESGGVAVPSLRVRRTETSVELGDGESFVISGLVSQQTIANVDKVPGLGDIPVLGAFFRSNRLDRSDRELIMVVTPHLVRPIAAGTKLPELPGEKARAYDPEFARFMLLEDGDFETPASKEYGFSD